MAIFIVLPLVLMLVLSLQARGSDDWTLDNFKNFFASENGMYMRIISDSTVLAGYSTVLCLLIGYPVAYFVSKLPSRQSSFFLIMLVLPTWLNFLLRTYSWMNLLGKNGLINKFLVFFGLKPMNLLYNNGAILLGMVYNFLPFMVYPIYSVMAKIKPTFLEAARDLGASEFQAFWKITFPLTIPGIITGIMMVFMPAVSTFVIPELLGGGQRMYIGNLIQHQFLQSGDWNMGSAVSILMMAMILVAMFILNKFDATGDKEDALW
ncbi:MAG: ABC transporter permease [Eubacteriaceae bacterium]|nr:ABC transporter permease [Eubacteriaceae bacterium]